MRGTRPVVAAIACVAVLATATGCTHRRTGIIVASIGAAGVIATSLAIHNCNNDGGCGDGLILALPVAIAVTVGGALGAATAQPQSTPALVLPYRPPPPPRLPPAPEPPPPPAEAMPDAAPAPAPPPDAAPSVPLSPNRIP